MLLSVTLEKFSKFRNTTDALKSARELIESKLSKSLKKFLTKQIVDKEMSESLAVADAKLGGIIKEKLGIKCVHDHTVEELMRGIRSQINNLLGSLGEGDMNAMSLGLSHSLSRYKLKFSPDKVDTMIVQAIGIFTIITLLPYPLYTWYRYECCYFDIDIDIVIVIILLL